MSASGAELPSIPLTGMSGTTSEADPACVPPAIANAVFHATGKRIRELPITPDRLKQEGRK